MDRYAYTGGLRPRPPMPQPPNRPAPAVVRRRSGRRRPRALAVILAVAAALLLPAPLSARTIVDFARLGDEVEREIEAGDRHVFKLDLVAGTEIEFRLEDREDSDGALTLRLLGPDDSLMFQATGEEPRIETALSAAGRYSVEVDSTAATEYRLRLDGEAPSQSGATVTVASGTAIVHLDVPRGASVELEVRRVAGAAPRVASVTDGLGRPLPISFRKVSDRRVKLHPIPVTAPGGLDVEVGGQGGGSGTYEVRSESESEDDGDGGEVEDRVSRRLVLVLAPGADPQAVADALGYELESVGPGFIVVETPEDRDGFEKEDAIEADLRLEEIVSSEPDARLHLPEGSQRNSPVLGSDFGRSAFESQPALTAIRAERAHLRATGAGVVVAVLDTGIDASHPFFAGRLLPGRDFVDGDDDPAEATDGIDDDGDGDIDEGYGHGTFVAGLVLGAAPDARVLPVRVLDTDGRGPISAIVAGIEFAVSQGADVINLSLGMQPRSALLGDAVRLAMANGVTVVAATGNRGDTAGLDFPARIRGAVAVTALDLTLRRRADFANATARTSLAAPGCDLLGPYPDPAGTAPDGSYAQWSGTSFSAALVSGGAALVLERRPGLLPYQVVQRVERRARPAPRRLPRPERRLLGHGRLDLQKLAR